MPKENIERGATIKNICNFCDGWCDKVDCDCVNCKSENRCEFMKDVANQPTADVVEVRHGNWLTKEYQYGEDGVSDEWIEKTAEQGDYAYCSLCLREALLNGCENWVLSDYCPHCGAKMDGKDK